MISRRSLLGGLSSLPFLNWNLQAKTTDPNFPVNRQALMGLYKKTARYDKNLLTDSKLFQKLSQYEADADTIGLSESDIQSLCSELNLRLRQNNSDFPLPVAFTGRVDLNSNNSPIKVETCYFKDGFLHRENGPAVIGINFDSGNIKNSILKFYENGEASDYNGVEDFIKNYGYRYFVHYKNANTPIGSPYVITATSVNTLCLSFNGEDVANLQHPHIIQINVDAEEWDPQHNDNFEIIYSKYLNRAHNREPNKLVPFLGKLTPAYEIRDRVVEFAENEFIRLEEMTKFFYENR